MTYPLSLSDIRKAKNMQRTRAYKFRGACHRMLALTDADRARGVVSYSSGNHALGAKIVTYEQDTQDSAQVVTKITRKTGRIEVPPSAQPQVLAGG